MSNLLDKASIILTPTAYNNGEALCVKPSDGSGDFDFSRNSAATRVNAQGLVENVQILSSNLVQNGDFSEEGSEEVSNGSFSQEGAEQITNGDFSSDTNWNYTTSWEISNGKANFTNIASKGFYQPKVLDANKTYRVSFDYSGTGQVGFLGTAGGSNTLKGFANYTEGNNIIYITPTTTTSAFNIWGNWTGAFSIDNVSVREVGQDWNLGTGWSIGDGEAKVDNTNANYISQDGIVSDTKTYAITFTILNYISGSIRLRLGNTYGDYVSGNGTYTKYIQCTASNKFRVYSSPSGANLSITNISVKEVGQNWLYSGQSEVSYNSGRIYSSDGSFSELYQEILSANKTYRLTFEIIEDSGGSLKIGTTRGGEEIASNVSGVGSFNYIFNVSSVNRLAFARLSGATDIRIDNISVIEITDDTNLPRINYEGFSYQDALGSEQILNGSFDSDTAWIKGGTWTISGGQANFNGGSGAIIWQNVLTSGKSYKFTFEITEQTTGSLRARCGGTLGTAHSAVGVYSEILICGGGIDAGLQTSSGAVLSCDNVSVKEYLGQEVVPDSGCGSWLWEPQSTNLITQSELFSDASWVKTYVTTIDNNSKSPDGNNNSSLMYPISSGNTRYISTNLTNGSAIHTISFFVKASGKNVAWLYINSSLANGIIYYDLSDETMQVVSGSVGTPIGTITSYTNDWYKITYTLGTASVLNSGSGIGVCDAKGDWAVTANGTDGIEIWGAQMEQQSYATSYIPTEGSTVTRNQDVCTNGGSLASINSTSGTLYFEGSALANDGTNRFISLTDGSNDNRVLFGYRAVSNQVFARVEGNNSASVDLTTVLSDTKINAKIAISYDSSYNYKMFVNGISADSGVGTDSIIGLDRLDFTNAIGTENFYGNIKALAVWKEALSDQELAELTTI